MSSLICRHRTPRILLSLLPLALSGCLGGVVPASPSLSPGLASEDGILRVQIVHTNDFHGRLLPGQLRGEPMGGSAVLAAWFDSVRVRFDGPTLLLSAGDDLQGTALSNLAWGRPTIEVHNRKGYDAAALGNHEFDWGIDTLRARVAESQFPWLAANVLEEGTGTHPTWIRPWTVVERDGIRVGVVGAALEGTPRVVMAGRTDGLLFQPEAPAIDRAAAELRAEGVDFVVLILHVGAYCTDVGDPDGQDPGAPSVGCDGPLISVLEALEHPVDLVLGGHTHQRHLFEVRGMPVMQNPAYAESFSLTELVRHPDGQVEAVHRELLTPWAGAVDPDTAVLAIVERWQAEVGPILEETVVVLAEPFSNADRRPEENPAGNLLADAQRHGTGTEVGLVNNGSLRRSLPAGPVSWGILYEFQPFQNELVRLRMDGALLREVLEHGLNDQGQPRIHVSGIRVEVDPQAPRGARVLRILREDSGSPIQPNEAVTVGTTEFLASGGDGFTMLDRGVLEPTGRVDLDALMEWLRVLPAPVQAPPGGRFILR
jgi:5'-nucleotidase